MVGVFKRSLSFPNKNPNRPSKPPLSHHIRSISLPCRSHPLISQFRNSINELKISTSDNVVRTTSASFCDNLSKLKDALDSMADIIQLPQTQESLHRQPKWVEKLLEDFLRFVDVYGILRTLVLALKEEHWATQVAIRKRDESKIALYIKSCDKIAKEIIKLAQTTQTISRCAVAGLDSVLTTISDVELVGLIRDVIEVTVSISTALFNGISLSFSSRKSSWLRLRLSKLKKVKTVKLEEVDEGIQEFHQICLDNLGELKRKGDEEVRMILKRMQELESWIGSIENGSEKVFRSLINNRVSLLNSLQ